MEPPARRQKVFQEESCPICLVNKPEVLSDCHHEYCYDCILKLKICGICRHNPVVAGLKELNNRLCSGGGWALTPENLACIEKIKICKQVVAQVIEYGDLNGIELVRESFDKGHFYRGFLHDMLIRMSRDVNRIESFKMVLDKIAGNGDSIDINMAIRSAFQAGNTLAIYNILLIKKHTIDINKRGEWFIWALLKEDFTLANLLLSLDPESHMKYSIPQIIELFTDGSKTAIHRFINSKSGNITRVLDEIVEQKNVDVVDRLLKLDVKEVMEHEGCMNLDGLCFPLYIAFYKKDDPFIKKHMKETNKVDFLFGIFEISDDLFDFIIQNQGEYESIIRHLSIRAKALDDIRLKNKIIHSVKNNLEKYIIYFEWKDFDVIYNTLRIIKWDNWNEVFDIYRKYNNNLVYYAIKTFIEDDERIFQLSQLFSSEVKNLVQFLYHVYNLEYSKLETLIQRLDVDLKPGFSFHNRYDFIILEIFVRLKKKDLRKLYTDEKLIDLLREAVYYLHPDDNYIVKFLLSHISAKSTGDFLWGNVNNNRHYACTSLLIEDNRFNKAVLEKDNPIDLIIRERETYHVCKVSRDEHFEACRSKIDYINAFMKLKYM